MLQICKINNEDIDKEDIFLFSIGDVAEVCWRGIKDGHAVYQPYIKITSDSELSFCYDGMCNAQNSFVPFITPIIGQIASCKKGDEIFFKNDGDVGTFDKSFSLVKNNSSIRLNNLNLWSGEGQSGIGADFRCSYNVFLNSSRQVVVQMALDEI